ncbi:hypothetical protein J2X90_000033 [Variovorax paradoxus]|uniref:YjbF family lipoprotein n=1 Tax=Variovorax paradoxus TaxID=34073 RepID=UPI0027853AB0|nr:YjbF family lipoprotein [Variovorax paradoxus]MDP9930309.1 hypothetical protein [Variovorax paradoxus]MDQ0022255.1 hypothetical protein [Variovorax paradoxus]
MLATARHIYGGGAATPEPVFNSNYRYLRVIVGGQTVYMVLGYIDKRPEGAVEVWYSNAGEVVRLLDGRIVGTTGLTTDWREVRFSRLPAWSEAVNASQPKTFERERDMMPGYRFGIRDEIVQTPIAAPQQAAVAGTAAASLRWYEERSVSRPSSASLPPARFGVSQAGGTPRVVYSEQCISNDLCMSFEQWTTSPPAPVAAASAGT